jgi:hypothetical protein
VLREILRAAFCEVSIVKVEAAGDGGHYLNKRNEAVQWRRHFTKPERPLYSPLRIRVGKENDEAPSLLLDRGEQPLKIAAVRDIAANGRDV